MAYCSVTSTPERFAQCLTNFQLDELLMLKKSMERMGALDDSTSAREDPQLAHTTDCPEAEASHVPQRMALMAADRGDYESTGSHAPWQGHSAPSWTEPKPSKLQTLFQVSITALAFLSFGGYLLCLIVQAIKSKGTTYFHPVATAMSTSNNGNVKRIKIYRRSKRSAHGVGDIPSKSILLQQDYATYMNAVRGQRWAMLT
ncbi:uncharacterized protein LOC111077393 [Drosophila obscura]|uniref:uncharacterized protein LOC111077393 n=1 Tax=Drosophila obscura TaxID=7282 RepID=UPI001BB24FC0|nr:uncharacterized protein LOC111077393 [Drosophila obscura]